MTSSLCYCLMDIVSLSPSRLSRWKTFKKAQSAFVKDRKEDVKHVVHPSSSSNSNPAPAEQKDGSRSGSSKSADSSDPKRNASSEGSSSRPESDDHAWLPENWRQAAIAGRRKAKSMIVPNAKKTDDEAIDQTANHQGSALADAALPESKAVKEIGPNDEGDVAKESARADTLPTNKDLGGDGNEAGQRHDGNS